MAGSAISASNQCRKVRVASPMPEKWPAHTETASSITLLAAKPATATQRSSSRSERSSSARSRSGSNGTTP